MPRFQPCLLGGTSNDFAGTTLVVIAPTVTLIIYHAANSCGYADDGVDGAGWQKGDHSGGI